MKSIKNILVACVAGLTVLLMLAYAIAWDFAAKKTRETLSDFYKQAASYGITIEGDLPAVTGFPGTPVIRFSGQINTKDGNSLFVPQLEIKGWLLPGKTATLSLPQGAAVRGANIDSSIDSIDSASLTIIIPATLPAAATVESLRGWRDTEGTLEITNFALRKGTLRADGQGTLKLDDALQPAGEVAATVRGHNAFLGWLQEKKAIEGKNALITAAVLNGLAAQDEKTGERVIKAAVTLQNNQVLLGPLPLLSLPKIRWPYSSPLSPIEVEVLE